MVAVEVIYAESRFRGAFGSMCKCLQIKFWPLSHGRHKGNSVEKYHQFLNKKQAIAGQDSGSHDVFIRNRKKISVSVEQHPNR